MPQCDVVSMEEVGKSSLASEKQVRMGTRSGQKQDQFSFINSIYKQPIRLNMTFTETSIVSR